MRSHSSILLSILLLLCQVTKAQMKTEQDLVNEIVICMQMNDDSSYAKLFPPFTLLTELAYTYSPRDSFENIRINRLRSNQNELRKFDPEFNPDIFNLLDFVHTKGADSGIHWGDITIVRYELQKQRLPRELIGFELIAPIRLHGYIFLQDMLTRRRYGVTVKDIYLLKDKWYGGMVMNILEANSIQEFEYWLREEQKELRKLLIAKKNGTLDSVLAAKDSIRKSNIELGLWEDEEEMKTIYKEIVDRKLFKGFLDKEYDIDLYIRYIKGTCPEPVCDWEAMYKIEGYDEYIFLDVERKEDGTYVFTEEEVGVMELQEMGGVMTGTWTSFRDKTEYEVYVKEEEEMKNRKLYKLDKNFEELDWSDEEY